MLELWQNSWHLVWNGNSRLLLHFHGSRVLRRCRRSTSTILWRCRIHAWFNHLTMILVPGGFGERSIHVVGVAGAWPPYPYSWLTALALDIRKCVLEHGMLHYSTCIIGRHHIGGGRPHILRVHISRVSAHFWSLGVIGTFFLWVAAPVRELRLEDWA